MWICRGVGRKSGCRVLGSWCWCIIYKLLWSNELLLAGSSSACRRCRQRACREGRDANYSAITWFYPKSMSMNWVNKSYFRGWCNNHRLASSGMMKSSSSKSSLSQGGTAGRSTKRWRGEHCCCCYCCIDDFNFTQSPRCSSVEIMDRSHGALIFGLWEGRRAVIPSPSYRLPLSVGSGGPDGGQWLWWWWWWSGDRQAVRASTWVVCRRVTGRRDALLLTRVTCEVYTWKCHLEWIHLWISTTPTPLSFWIGIIRGQGSDSV